MTERLDLALLVGAAVVLVGVAAVRLALRLGLPSLLLYLGIGLALGESGLGLDESSAPAPGTGKPGNVDTAARWDRRNGARVRACPAPPHCGPGVPTEIGLTPPWVPPRG